jgi:hypothetical protein
VDFKTSGGHDSHNAMQLSLTRRSNQGLAFNAQYTLSKSYGNTGGSNEAQTSANLARTMSQFDYDLGYNNFDVRHTFNVSAIYALPFGTGRHYDLGKVGNAIAGGWDVGGILNARSGLPVDIKIVRPDVLYVDGSGNYFTNPAADRTAVINTPGGGASRNVRRPDLVPGVDPFINAGGLLFLNPAAFSTPAPGQWGNLERGSIKGPSFRQFDMVISRRFGTGNGPNFDFRAEIFNLFNTVNFTNPVGTLPLALPANSLTEANKLQPGQPYTAASAGTFGKLTSTVGKTVGLGTSRQVFSIQSRGGIAASISPTSASESTRSAAPTMASTWDGRRNPTIAAVTPGWRSVHATATWPAGRPCRAPARPSNSAKARFLERRGSWNSGLLRRKSSSGKRATRCFVMEPVRSPDCIGE